MTDETTKHLGRDSSGNVMAPYVTPNKIDPTLLVAVPRAENRTKSNIFQPVQFVGFDSWNCYEFSTLNSDGFPLVGLLRIVYNSDSEYIVESKSLKLYLNSFNMVRSFASTLSFIKNSIQTKVSADLSALLKTKVDVCLHLNTDNTCPKTVFENYETLENTINYANVKLPFEQYQGVTSITKTTRWHTGILRSNCRVTNQPDWADLYVRFKGTGPTRESFLSRIISLRSENHFHEEVCELLYHELSGFSPEELLVACLYTRRGGIDINPVRASRLFDLSDAMDLSDEKAIIAKTMRQ
jgi:7-cyano-7-deazaguanine reductase